MANPFEKQIREAVRQFWRTKRLQSRQQGSGGGKKDQGNRSAVTGGKHLDGFAELFRQIANRAGIDSSCVYTRKSEVVLPGFFRATKQWDLLIVHDQKLLAAIEFKSQVGSLGNNANNRAEEAVGNATDFWTAYRDNIIPMSPRPWLGFLFLLEDSDDSTKPVRILEPHFQAHEMFQNTSYMERYVLCCKQMIRERLYDAAALIASDSVNGPKGTYREPDQQVGIEMLITAISAHLRSNAEYSHSE